MPGAPIRILVIESDSLLTLDICTNLETEGYAVVGTASTGAQALDLFQASPVDLVLCDVLIKGKWDGIETIARLLALRAVPVIYLTAVTDKPTVARALSTLPAAYLTKPATAAGLRAAIELALYKSDAQTSCLPPKDAESLASAKEIIAREVILHLGEHVFLKHDYKFVRITLQDIVMLEADNMYTELITTSRKYALRLKMSSVLERLHVQQLVRIHRSYAVNIHHIDTFNENEMTVAGQVVPIGRQYKDAFLQRFLLP
jgi:DNA-binding LytR/AlgR family response regulator